MKGKFFYKRPVSLSLQVSIAGPFAGLAYQFCVVCFGFFEDCSCLFLLVSKFLWIVSVPLWFNSIQCSSSKSKVPVYTGCLELNFKKKSCKFESWNTPTYSISLALLQHEASLSLSLLGLRTSVAPLLSLSLSFFLSF